MKGRHLGGRPVLLSVSEGDDLIHDFEIDDTSDVSGKFCLPLRECGNMCACSCGVVCPLVVVVRARHSAT